MKRLAAWGAAIMCIMHSVACATAGAEAAASARTSGGSDAVGAGRLTSAFAPREYAGEVHGGDAMVGTGHGKTYAFTWSAATDVEVRYSTGIADAAGSATGTFPAWLRVESPDAAARDHTPPAPHGKLYFHAQPIVRYELAIAGYDPQDMGAFLLEVSPPPTQEVVAPALAKPEPKAPEELVSDAEVAAEAKRLREGYTLSGKTVIGTLDKPGKHTFAAQRGQCYRAIVTLGPGARLTYSPKMAMPSFTMKSPAENRGVAFSANRYASGGNARVLVSTDDVCPSAAGTGTLAWPEVVGGGGFALEVYARPTPESAIIARDVADEASVCSQCSRENIACRVKPQTAAGACQSAYDRCARRATLTRAKCGAP